MTINYSIMNKKAYVFFSLAFLFALTIITRNEIQNTDISAQTIYQSVVTHLLSPSTTPRQLTEENVKKYCAKVDFTKNITSVGTSFIKGTGGEKTRNLILNLLSNGTKAITDDIMGAVSTCSFTAAFTVIFILLFLIMLIGGVFCSSCHCCGCCCGCCKKKGVLNGTKGYVLYGLLIASLACLGVMAFFGSGFSSKIPNSVDTMFCSVSLITDEVMNGVNENYSIRTPVPKWIGVNSVMSEVNSILQQVQDTINEFPSTSVDYHPSAFSDSRDEINNHLKGGDFIIPVGAASCNLMDNTCGFLEPQYIPYGFQNTFIDAVRPPLIQELDTIEMIWKNISEATNYTNQMDEFKNEANTQISNANDQINNLNDTISSFSTKLDSYMVKADKPLSYTSVVVMWFFIGWGLLGFLLLVSICLIDKANCKLFWICNHISWIIMHAIVTLVMLLCVVFTILTFSLENGCQLVDYYYPTRINEIPMIGGMGGYMTETCITGNGDIISSLIKIEDILSVFSLIETPLATIKSSLDEHADMIGADGKLDPPVIKAISTMFNSYLVDYNEQVYGTSYYAIPSFFLYGDSPVYDLEDKILNQMAFYSYVKEVKFKELDCSLSYNKLYTYDAAPAGSPPDSCLVLDGPLIDGSWVNCLECSDTCTMKCLSDYYNNVNSAIYRNGDGIDRYIDILDEYIYNVVISRDWMMRLALNFRLLKRKLTW